MSLRYAQRMVEQLTCGGPIMTASSPATIYQPPVANNPPTDLNHQLTAGTFASAPSSSQRKGDECWDGTPTMHALHLAQDTTLVWPKISNPNLTCVQQLLCTPLVSDTLLWPSQVDSELCHRHENLPTCCSCHSRYTTSPTCQSSNPSTVRLKFSYLL